jgi:hypothetical protein
VIFLSSTCGELPLFPTSTPPLYIYTSVPGSALSAFDCRFPRTVTAFEFAFRQSQPSGAFQRHRREKWRHYGLRPAVRTSYKTVES